MNSSKMYKPHRFPPDIIQYTVWLYHRFNLNHRDIEDLLAERGIAVSYEAIRMIGLRHVQDLNMQEIGVHSAGLSLKVGGIVMGIKRVC